MSRFKIYKHTHVSVYKILKNIIWEKEDFHKTQKMELSTVAIISLLGFPLLQLFQNQTLSTCMVDSCSE